MRDRSLTAVYTQMRLIGAGGREKGGHRGGMNKKTYNKNKVIRHTGPFPLPGILPLPPCHGGRLIVGRRDANKAQVQQIKKQQ